MDPSEPVKKSLVAQIAQEWGTTRAYVYKLAKKGCPTDSIEAATEWRSANAKLGVGYRSSGGLRPDAEFSEEKNPESGIGAGVAKQTTNWGAGSYRKTRINVKTIEKSLLQAIRMETIAAEVVEAAQANPERMLTAMNVYNKAQANRMETEKRVLEYQQARRELITSDEAKAMMAKGWMPILARLRSVPTRAAMKANPFDDALAKMVIEDEIEAAIAEGQASYAEVVA
ncbi:MAG: hypothetical protein EBY32_16255 [Proteobacteria bacterium]|nr:hypothetical protein [Pseudomonadota bacterium]